MLKLTVVALMCCLLVSGSDMTNNKSNNSGESEAMSNEMEAGTADMSAAEYEAALHAIRRGMLAQVLLKERLQQQQQQLQQQEDADEPVEAKRSPKWRMGETRSRVDLSNLNPNFKHSVLKQYENWGPKMREKNRLYEKFHG